MLPPISTNPPRSRNNIPRGGRSSGICTRSLSSASIRTLNNHKNGSHFELFLNCKFKRNLSMLRISEFWGIIIKQRKIYFRESW